MSKEPAQPPPAEPDDDTRDEQDEFRKFLNLGRRLVAVPKEEIDAARSNGPRSQAS